MPTLTLTISPQAFACLGHLVRGGLYGRTEAKTAAMIINRGLEEMVADGIIPQEVLKLRQPRPSKRLRP